MRYLVDHPNTFLEGVSLRQRGWEGAPQSENDLAVVEYLMYAHHPEYAEYIENIMRQKADRQLERIKGTKQ